MELSYQPGLHLIGDIESKAVSKMRDHAECRTFIDEQISKHGLSKVGEVYHSFDGAGFTATICLTESHISIHTWPEFGKVTFDVFLSNFKKNNNHITEAIFEAIKNYFESTVIVKNTISR